MSYQQQISVTTKGHGDMHDLTEQVTSVVNASGIQTGTVNVFNFGSPAAIGAIEFEPQYVGRLDQRRLREATLSCPATFI